MDDLGRVSHSFADETPESKARWFQSLPVEERMEAFCEFMDLLLALNPELAEGSHAEPVAGRVLVLSLP